MDEFLGQVTLRGCGADMLPEKITGYPLQHHDVLIAEAGVVSEEEKGSATPNRRSLVKRKSFRKKEALQRRIQGSLFLKFVQEEVENLGHANPHRPSILTDKHVFVYDDTDPEEGGHRTRICGSAQNWWRIHCKPKKKSKKNQVSRIVATNSAPVDELNDRKTDEMVQLKFSREKPDLVIPPPATPRDPPPADDATEEGAHGPGTAATYKSAEANSTAGTGDHQPNILKADAVASVADQLKHNTMPRDFAKSMLAYTYCIIVGVASALLIAGVTINFGEEKTIDFILFTAQSLGLRLFLFEP
eukprot:SAG31_NODE_5610_length_2424_cov_2.145065_1_plen_301_part_10